MDQWTLWIRQVPITKHGFSPTCLTQPTVAEKFWLSKILYAYFDHTIADEDKERRMKRDWRGN